MLVLKSISYVFLEPLKWFNQQWADSISIEHKSCIIKVQSVPSTRETVKSKRLCSFTIKSHYLFETNYGLFMTCETLPEMGSCSFSWSFSMPRFLFSDCILYFYLFLSEKFRNVSEELLRNFTSDKETPYWEPVILILIQYKRCAFKEKGWIDEPEVQGVFILKRRLCPCTVSKPCWGWMWYVMEQIMNQKEDQAF